MARLLLEDGFSLLLEDGGHLLLDEAVSMPVSDGAGATGAGELPMGQEAYTKASAIDSNLKSQYVPYFDIQTKSFIRDETGRLKLVHWVDQAVALALGVFNGAHAADPDLGNKINKIPRSAPNKIQAEVEDAVRIALQRLVDGKHIGVLRIETDTKTVRGRILVAVHYINRRLYLDAAKKYTFVFG